MTSGTIGPDWSAEARYFVIRADAGIQCLWSSVSTKDFRMLRLREGDKFKSVPFTSETTFLPVAFTIKRPPPRYDPRSSKTN